MVKRLKPLRLLAFAALAFFSFPSATAQTAPAKPAGLLIEIPFVRQGGIASNQFAIWIEGIDGTYVKTIYATRFTATKGWKTRPDSLPRWAKASGIAAKSNSSVDSLSGATPKSGKLAYSWDFTDESGKSVKNGKYVVRMEGSIRWKDKIDVEAELDTLAVSIGAIRRSSTGGTEKENAMLGEACLTYY